MSKNTYVTSDTHFTHKNIIKFQNRPFSSIDEMDTALIENWNSIVNKDDEVYHLGDFGWKDNAANLKILKQLNGTKYLVRGNHDFWLIQDKQIQNEFEWIKDYHEIKLPEGMIVMCHYPFTTWNMSHYGSINLCGHTHGSLKTLPHQFDVGVDVFNFKPIPLDSFI